MFEQISEHPMAQLSWQVKLNIAPFISILLPNKNIITNLAS